MGRLYLLRHGEAVPHGTPGVAEDDRPLTKDGEDDVERVGRGLRRLGVDVRRIVTSPLPRARRTAEIVADALGHGVPVEMDELLRPETPATALARRYESATDDLMLV